jgi:hypothetical protein
MPRQVETTAPLPVPMLTPLQEDNFSCVPRCIKMIFMFIEENFENCTLPNLTLEEIGIIVETDETGTFPDTIPNLNNVRAVFRARPSIEFEYKERWHSKEELETEVSARQPPIVWIWAEDKEKLHQYHHAVVITGLENEMVYFNDPVFGKMSQPLDEFLSKWHDENTILVKVKITRKLEEFFDNAINKQEQPILKEGN